MGLEMRVKRAILRELAQRYQRGRKKEKTRVLEEFIGLTGYNRSYGSWLLGNYGRKVVLSGGRWAAGSVYRGGEAHKAEAGQGL